MRFSGELIEETKEYFLEISGDEISDDVAIDYLEKLAAVGLIVFGKFSGGTTVDSGGSCDPVSASKAPKPQGSCQKTTGLVPVVKGKALGQGARGTELVSQYPQTPLGDDG